MVVPWQAVVIAQFSDTEQELQVNMLRYSILAQTTPFFSLFIYDNNPSPIHLPWSIEISDQEDKTKESAYASHDDICQSHEWIAVTQKRRASDDQGFGSTVSLDIII